MGTIELLPGDLLLDFIGAPDYDAMLDPAGPIRARGIIRYVDSVNPANPKCVRQADVDACTKWGAALLLVHERAANDALVLSGALAGYRARQIAAGPPVFYPQWMTLIAADDTDITASTSAVSRAYVVQFDRAGGPATVYGEYSVIEDAAADGIPAPLWQTEAWSSGLVSPSAHVLQLINHTIDLSPALAGMDENRVLRSFMAWTPAVTHTPDPTMEDDMAQLWTIGGTLFRVDGGKALWLPGRNADEAAIASQMIACYGAPKDLDNRVLRTVYLDGECPTYTADWVGFKVTADQFRQPAPAPVPPSSSCRFVPDVEPVHFTGVGHVASVPGDVTFTINAA